MRFIPYDPIIQAGTFGPLNTAPVASGITFGMHQNIRTSYITRLFFYFKDGYGEVWYPKEDARLIGQDYIGRVIKDPAYIDKVYNQWLKDVDKFEQLGRQLAKSGELTEYNEFYNLFQKLWAGSMVAEVFDGYYEDLLQSLAARYGVEINPDEIEQVLQTGYVSNLIRFEHFLLQCLNEEKDFAAVVDKYYYIDTDYYQAKEVALDKRLAEYKKFDLVKELERVELTINNQAANAGMRQELLAAKKFPPEFVAILDLLAKTVEWRDERKRMHQTGVYCQWRFMLRNILVPEELFPFITPQDYLERAYDEKNYQQILEKRKHGSIFKEDFQANREWLYDAEAMIKFKSQFRVDQQKSLELKGRTAYEGKVTGKAKIIRSRKDFDKMEAGDILVASMTRPEYLPVMKKAAAVVTDEGGITCHAAIVCRELNIPCVISTQQATQTILDGDTVFVNANHGFVSVVQR